MNEGAQGGPADWNMTSAEFVPKSFNQLPAQTVPSQLPVNATAKTAFPIYYSTMSLLNNSSAQAGFAGQPLPPVENAGSYLKAGANNVPALRQQPQTALAPADSAPGVDYYFDPNVPSFNDGVAAFAGRVVPMALRIAPGQHVGQSEKFQTMRKTEICTKWESSYCKWGDKVSTRFESIWSG